MLWAIEQHWLLHYGPLCVISLAGLGLRVYVLILVPRYGPKQGTSFKQDTNWIPCVSTGYVHVYTTVKPHACGCVSTCMWPCIHVHRAMWPNTEFSYVPRARAQNFMCMLFGPQYRILFCIIGHSTKLGYALWVIVQNLVKCCGPWRSMDPSEESHKLQIKTCHILY